MIDAMVGSYTGYAQVHTNGYWEEQTIDNSLELTPELQKLLQDDKEIIDFVPRLEGFALSAVGDVTKGAMVVGVDVDKEEQYNQLHERVVEGEYISSTDKAVMVGAGLAEYLKVGVGDTVVLIGTGYHGASAAGKYPIKAIVKFGSPDLSKQLVFMPMHIAQPYFDVENRYSALILQFDNKDNAIAAVAALKDEIGEEYEILDWQELVPDIIQMIETDRAEGYVFMFILYMVISFGIFGTVLMMLAERQHEFGVLIAIGMKRIKLAAVVWSEVIIISLLGALLGMLGAFPICYNFHVNPIDLGGEEMGDMYEEYGMEAVLQSSIDWTIFSQQATIVFFVAAIIAVYPFLSILRINAIKAMRS